MKKVKTYLAPGAILLTATVGGYFISNFILDTIGKSALCQPSVRQSLHQTNTTIDLACRNNGALQVAVVVFLLFIILSTLLFIAGISYKYTALEHARTAGHKKWAIAIFYGGPALAYIYKSRYMS